MVIIQKACFQSICKISVCNKMGIWNNIKALHYPLPEICDALNELAEESGGAMIKSEAETLYETLKQ